MDWHAWMVRTVVMGTLLLTAVLGAGWKWDLVAH
jgi:hypothetical protein